MKKATVLAVIASLPLVISSFVYHQSYYTANDKVQDKLTVTLEDTTFTDLNILFIHDTAATDGEIRTVLDKNFHHLIEVIARDKLTPYAFMGWYYSNTAPWRMDAAIAVNRLPVQLSTPVQSRIVKGGKVLIAHVCGPYRLMGNAYKQIWFWLKQNKRRPAGLSFEVYINDPQSVNSESEIETDIYQPIR